LAWLYYFLLQKLPLSSDEAYFSHVFWLLKHGYRQYIDFYSNHLPFYFETTRWFLPTDERPLGFIWSLRAISIVVMIAYAAMLRPALWPYLLMFAVFGRIAEIRPDTFGLLLFNGAWLLLLKDRKKAILAASIASLALLFSARAAVMMVPMGLICLYCARRKWPLFAIGGLWLALLGLIYLAAPGYALLVVRSVYLDTLGFERVAYATRFLQPERLVLIAMMVAALANAGIGLMRKRNDRDLVTVVAIVGQLVLIVVDPSPFEYVYGWSMLPVLLALPGSDFAKTVAAFGFAAAIAAMSAAYPVIKGHEPESPFLHLTFEAPISSTQWTTAQLATQLFHRHSLWNQIAAREELCRRMGSRTVVAYFWFQPICMKDALYEWIGLSWPRGFHTIKQPPALILWGSAGRKPVELLGGYAVYDGFALAPDVSAKRLGLIPPDVDSAKAGPTTGQVKAHIN
jgi:hypothetical protein